MNYYNEIDPIAVMWLKSLIDAELIPNGDVDGRSIAELQPADLMGYTQCHFFAGIGGWALALQLAGWPKERKVWTASCPCQPFSNPGPRNGINDKRHLWPEFNRLAIARKPYDILGEQVCNLAWWDIAASDMEASGYTTRAESRVATSVGADHERRRLYWAATSNSNGFRQQKQRDYWQNTSNNPADSFREANRLVDAFRRKAMPFLCRWHNGVSVAVGEAACKGFGNAIVPEAAAEFIISVYG